MARKVSPAFKLGAEDFSRGHKTNPFPFGRWHRQWAAGYERARENAAAPTKQEDTK